MFLEGQTIGFNGFSMVSEILRSRAMVNNGLEANNVLRLQCADMNIKDDWQGQVRLHHKGASSRLGKFHSFERTLLI